MQICNSKQVWNTRGRGSTDVLLRRGCLFPPKAQANSFAQGVVEVGRGSSKNVDEIVIRLVGFSCGDGGRRRRLFVRR